MNHLEHLVNASLEQMAARAARVPLAEVRARALAREPPRGFASALKAAKERGDIALIAEAKRASPSRGAIAADLDPARLARSYEKGGAACMSVLTERASFGGSLEDLVQARAACGLPVLRKDFLVTPYQIWEARAYGADAVLLIAAALEAGALVELRGLARELRLDVLFEVHGESEIEAARAVRPDLLGINARDLKTLAVDAGAFARLLPHARGIAPLVAESGVRTPADARRYVKEGADALLVGEALSSANDPEYATRALVRG
ncbi:MAG: indole-3-glycerol phosphate synthase TrpC [Myxococcales bacterium]